MRKQLRCSLMKIMIGYLDLFKVVELACDKHNNELVASHSLDEIVHYDLWARDYAAGLQLPIGLSVILLSIDCLTNMGFTKYSLGRQRIKKLCEMEALGLDRSVYIGKMHPTSFSSEAWSL